MAFTQTLDLPPLDISPVHAQITILPSSGEYIAYVITDAASEIHIRLKPHDVKNLNSLLQGAIQQVAGSFGQETAYETALAELARMGNYAFQRIFPDTFSQETIRDALNAGTIVQIVSKDFFVPWELLYDGPLGAQTSISYYWGMSHIISRTIIQNVRPGAHVSPIVVSERPKVGLVTSDRLPYVEKQEIPALRKFHQSRSIQLTPLRPLSTTQRSDELAELGRFLGQELEIIHFACHAYEQDPLEESYLFITRDFPISMIDFVVGKYELKHNPFVILNACLTSIISPLYTSSWAEKLWERGARGVLATDFRVPDWFAASFSEVLYGHLLSGMPIGETLLTTRRHFWSEQRNPLGLAYSLYSPPSINFASVAPPPPPSTALPAPAPAPVSRQIARPSRVNGRTILLIGLAFLVIVSGVVGLFSLIHANPDHATATATAQANATANALNATATAQAQALATASAIAAMPNHYGGTLAFDDPLRDNSGGHRWYENGSNCLFTGGAYHVSESSPNSGYYCSAFPDFSNFAFEVQMTMSKGNGGGGITFRNTNNIYYILYVNQDGTYELDLDQGTSPTKVLVPPTSTPAIHRGLGQTNVIAVVANGSAMTLYVNYQKLANSTNRSSSHGQIGVVAYANSQPTEVVYSNAKVWTL